ncbi:MAG: EAL domain-containing protein [Treponema sp.]|nr:EAL domain-containing protein [Treponema sp.]
MNRESDINKAKILLIESSQKNVDMLKNFVSEHFEVTLVTPESIVDTLINGSQKYSTAIIESESALSVLQKLRDNPKTENFPVLISTTIEDISLENELLDLGSIDFLKKPFNKRRVLNRIKTAVKISESNRIISELEHDELTGLLTRKSFLQKAKTIIDNNPDKTFCLLAFDFDNFKSSNTLYGVDKCNEFLSYTAKKMMSLTKEGIAGRFGGDQFILLLKDSDRLNIERLDNISKAVLENAPIPHQVVKIGVYAPIDRSVALVICCDRAFFALNEIKGIYGKDIAFFADNIQNRLLSEQRIIESMEYALQNNQFQVFYQPKHESITGHIAGAEALVRWKNSEYGYLAPNEFIPLFEKNGFITKLDNFVLEQVCKDINRWQQEGLPLVPISVNFSRRDFLEEGCIEKQFNIIEHYGIDHNLLHMEVTESLYSENTEIIISQLKQTQKRGFMIEMDDFGAGYSSLGLLSTFPLNVIKLDISFVRNIKTNEVVIENIIKMAHRMGLLTVAEGAESHEEFKILKSLGCDYIQGYFFSGPLQVRDFESYLRKTSVLSYDKTAHKKTKAADSPVSEEILTAANEVAEGIPGGFLSCHADGNLELISFNHELIQMYGCETAEEFREYVGNSFKGIVHPDDFERVLKSINFQLTPENDMIYVEYRIKSKDGTIKYIKNYGRHVLTNNYGGIFYIFLNDITIEERLKAEVEVELAKKMELQKMAESASFANQAKNIFMYNISKDMITIMKDIITHTNDIKTIINDNAVENKKTATNETIKNIERSEEQLMTFINNVYELAQIEKNEIQVTEIPTDITLAVERIYDLIKEEVEKRGIEVEYWIDFKYPYIYQDIIHTTDVVMNIIYNAIKYTPRGGKIKFNIKQIPDTIQNGCTIEFTCEDNGIGMPEDFLPNACKDFAREDNEINKENPSAGLGLSIAKSLISLMNGTIEIKSSKGKGTIVKTSQTHHYAKKEDVEKTPLLIDNLRL